MLQLVQRFDQGLLPASLGIVTYQALWASVQTAMFHTHVESTLKADIIREPERYVQLDPEMAATLLDMKEAGKQLILITNSDWQYTKSLMSFAYDRCAPQPTGTAGHRNGAATSSIRPVTHTPYIPWPSVCVAVLLAWLQVCGCMCATTCVRPGCMCAHHKRQSTQPGSVTAPRSEAHRGAGTYRTR